MTINFQNIAVLIIFLGAVVFLCRKFIFPAKSKKDNNCGSGQCGC